jgi:hypothetical protein
MEFYVTTDRAYVKEFSIRVNVPECGGIWTITRLSPDVPIQGGAFSFTGSFFAAGTFQSETSASGVTGLDHHYLPGCGWVSGGPWSWSATWQNSSQPTSPSRSIEKLEPGDPRAEGEAYRATRVE